MLLFSNQIVHAAVRAHLDQRVVGQMLANRRGREPASARKPQRALRHRAIGQRAGLLGIDKLHPVFLPGKRVAQLLPLFIVVGQLQDAAEIAELLRLNRQRPIKIERVCITRQREPIQQARLRGQFGVEHALRIARCAGG